MWRESSWARPLAVFILDFGLWVLLLAVGLSSGSWVVRTVLVLPLTLVSAQLFMLAHDAGHRSYSTSRAVNGLVGRLALVPSMHVLGLWRDHHNLHHRFTNLRGRDFVWTPLSVTEYRALPRWRRGLHRVYRHGSGLGLGLYYTVEIWAARMLWPRARHGLHRHGQLIADSIALYGALVGLVASAWTFVAVTNPDRLDETWFWISAAALQIVLPLVATHWLIGFVIYFNHTHPDVVWYDDPDEWSRHDAQLEGSTGLVFSRLRHALLPRRIMNHTAHHVDPAIPLRRLGAAQRHLVSGFGDRIISYQWSLKTFYETLSHCKLYDYDARRWVPFASKELS